MKSTSALLMLCLALAVGVALAVGGALAAKVTLDTGERSASDLKRDSTSKPNRIIEFSGVSEGMTVADILGGGGYYSELLSQVVGKSGKVYLHNNQAYLRFVGKELKARMKGKRLGNVVDHKREADRLGFADNSLDAIFFILGYHDLYHTSDSWNIDAEGFLNQLTQALKPGGLLLVVDHAALPDSNTRHAQKLHRIDEQYVKRELFSKGFAFVKDSQILRNHQDSRLISPFIPEIRRKTDRFVLLFKKR